MQRRTFIKRCAGLGVGLGFPMIIPASALGRGGAVAPSERITLGHIGCGKMGNGLVHGFTGMDDVQVVACCDVETIRLGRFKAFLEKVLADRLGQEQATGVAAYEDYLELLARPDIDGVVVSTPDHWHANITIAACRAGKDVYCEKPLTHTAQEAYDVRDAVQRYGRILQTGSQQRSDREFRFAVEMVRNGRIGQVHSINVSVGGSPRFTYDLCEERQTTFNWDRWIGPSAVQPYNTFIAPMDPIKSNWAQWRHYSDFGGGGQFDWGAHMYDIAQWALRRDGDAPVEVIPPDPNDPERQHLTYVYADGMKMTRRSITRFEGRSGGLEFIGDQGAIYVHRGQLESHPAHLKLEPTRADEDPVYRSTNHQRNFVDCVKTRQPTVCNETVGASTAVVCALGAVAERIGQPFKFDYARGLTDNASANRLLNPPKRARYTV